MAKKRKTLPKNFRDLVGAGDIEALKAVFDQCEIGAYSGYNKEPALSFFRIPPELVRWLVEQGADINQRDGTYGRTPLHFQTMIRSADIEVFLELGADVTARDIYGSTPLHMAAGSAFSPPQVQALLARGADPLGVDDRGTTPLARALERASNTDIEELAQVAVILLEAGTPITEKMREQVTRIGQQFEFHREAFNKESLPATDAALSQLYQLFGVAPVARRQTHTGNTPILVPEGGTPLEKHQALWELLVPSRGAAQTVQGEVVRITGRVHDEIYRNGGANWDGDYRKMLDGLLVHLASGTPLDQPLLAEAAALVKALRPRGMGDQEPGRLCQLAVLWVGANPQPVPLKAPDYRR